MNERSSDTNDEGAETHRSLLAELIDKSRLYRTGEDYMKLLNFVSRLRHMAPFNAMLLRIQKPGLQFAASAHDWKARFNRDVKEGARPLLIMWPFSPVALVFDVDDTEGIDPLPADVAATFRAFGDIAASQLTAMFTRLIKVGLDVKAISYGSGHAGHITSLKVEHASGQRQEKSRYSIRLNKEHDPNVQFATLAHELGHLFLGHLGRDPYRSIPDRRSLTYPQRELEAEAVSYIVCSRQGVDNISEAYLSAFVREGTTVDALDVDAIMRAAGRVEADLGLAAKINFG